MADTLHEVVLLMQAIDEPMHHEAEKTPQE